MGQEHDELRTVSRALAHSLTSLPATPLSLSSCLLLISIATASLILTRASIERLGRGVIDAVLCCAKRKLDQ